MPFLAPSLWGGFKKNFFHRSGQYPFIRQVLNNGVKGICGILAQYFIISNDTPYETSQHVVLKAPRVLKISRLRKVTMRKISYAYSKNLANTLQSAEVLEDTTVLKWVREEAFRVWRLKTNDQINLDIHANKCFAAKYLCTSNGCVSKFLPHQKAGTASCRL